MPGVSMNTSWLAPSMAMPRTGMRVVCTLWLTIADLGADQGVDQRRLAGVGRADDGDEAAAGFGPASRAVSRSLIGRLPDTPSRASSAVAAACSAARLLAPSPRAGFVPLMRTSAVKRGA